MCKSDQCRDRHSSHDDRNDDRRSSHDDRYFDRDKIKADKGKIKCLCSRRFYASHACLEEADVKMLKADEQKVNNLCVAEDLGANRLSAQSVNTANLCSSNASIDRLCVNELTALSMNRCEKYRALVTLSSDTTYTLGQSVPWDTILDDPNGNTAVGPFGYTVPESGYYTFTYQAYTHGLQGAQVINGPPISNLEIMRNGNHLIDNQLQFLTFNNSQSANLSAMVLLNAGDVITMRYQILVVDPVAGFTPYVGTIELEGNGLFDGSSYFAIHFLSPLSCTPGQECLPCEPLPEPCEPVEMNCENPCFHGEDDCNFKF